MEVSLLPRFATERIGVGAAEVEFSQWGWMLRTQPVLDHGIDAHVEPWWNGAASGPVDRLADQGRSIVVQGADRWRLALSRKDGAPAVLAASLPAGHPHGTRTVRVKDFPNLARSGQRNFHAGVPMIRLHHESWRRFVPDVPTFPPLPVRSAKPRISGLTHVLDSGMTPSR